MTTTTDPRAALEALDAMIEKYVTPKDAIDAMRLARAALAQMQPRATCGGPAQCAAICSQHPACALAQMREQPAVPADIADGINGPHNACWFRDHCRSLLAAAPSASAPEASQPATAQAESAAFDEWWRSSGQGAEPLHTLITENCARATWHERARRSAPPAAPAQDEKQAFEAWSATSGYDTAHTYDTDRSRWVFLNPMTADLWKCWRAACAAMKGGNHVE